MILDHNIIFILLACLFGLLMTWSVGANDLANVMSTAMGSKSITALQAIIIAIIFEFAGAFFGGSRVSDTLRNGIIDVNQLTSTPEILLYGMLAVLLAGTVWMLLASALGLPVSVTNTIVGAIVGFGAIVLGLDALHVRQIIYIIISWIASPTIAGVIAYFIFISIRRFILGDADPFIAAKRYAPFYFFIVGIVLAIMVVLKGLNHFNIHYGHSINALIVIMIGGTMVIVGKIIVAGITLNPVPRLRIQFVGAEKIFSILMAFTACAMVFAHGSNDVAIAVGPMASVITIAQSGDHLTSLRELPSWIILLGCGGVILGLMMYGRKVIETVGSGITELTPSRAFAATLAAASTVVASTSLGIPVSATQTLVGAILGVGLARGIGALNLRVVRNIFMSWIITIPVGAMLTIVFFNIFKKIFGA